MRRLIPILVLLFASESWAADPNASAPPNALNRIAEQVDRHAVVRAEFTQSKRMAALKRPLVSSGRLVFSRQHGVLWQIERPYRMSYVLGAESITEIAADGTRRTRGMREVPGLAQVGRVFRALFAADIAALSDDFDIGVQEDSGDREMWAIELRPRQQQLARFLLRLRLTGGRFVESILIEEHGNGDKEGGESGGENDVTQIRFANSQSAEVPSAAELLIFGGTTKP
jgi:hypothetical protein